MKLKKASKSGLSRGLAPSTTVLRIINKSGKRAINYMRWGDYMLAIDRDGFFKLVTKGGTDSTDWMSEIELTEYGIKCTHRDTSTHRECYYLFSLKEKTAFFQRIIMNSNNSYSVVRMGQVDTELFKLEPRVIKRKARIN